jgi:hypothetical protein
MYNFIGFGGSTKLHIIFIGLAVVILEEFLADRPRHHRQRVTFLEVMAAADIILPLIDVLLHFVDTYMLFRLMDFMIARIGCIL